MNFLVFESLVVAPVSINTSEAMSVPQPQDSTLETQPVDVPGKIEL